MTIFKTLLTFSPVSQVISPVCTARTSPQNARPPNPRNVTTLLYKNFRAVDSYAWRVEQQAAAAQKLNCVLFLNVYLEALCPFSFPPRIQNVTHYNAAGSDT